MKDKPEFTEHEYYLIWNACQQVCIRYPNDSEEMKVIKKKLMDYLENGNDRIDWEDKALELKEQLEEAKELIEDALGFQTWEGSAVQREWDKKCEAWLIQVEKDEK